MALIIKCSNCDFVFFKDNSEAMQPIDIIRKNVYKCPACYNKLNFSLNKITLKINNRKEYKKTAYLNREVNVRRIKILVK